MRTLLYFTAIASIANFNTDGFCQTASSPLPYPVSHLPIDGEQIKRIHQAVVISMAEHYTLKANRSKATVQIIQSIPGKGYLITDGNINAFLETPASDKYADGESADFYLEKTDELYRYESVLGAEKTLRIFRILQIPDIPDLSQFIQLLKDGKRYTIIQGERHHICKRCGGFGGSEAANLNLKDCRCGNISTWSEPNHYEIFWE